MKALRTAITESPGFRRWARTASGRYVFGSPLITGAQEIVRRRAIAAARRQFPDQFADTRMCFLFVGPTKSGGTLLGSLLDAHPVVMCSDELGLARVLLARGDADSAFRLVARNSAREALRGRVTSRRLDPYAFQIPGQSQGAADSPVAVGDSRAGPTTRLLAARPGSLDELQNVLGNVSLRLIQVVRNPFDPLAVMVVRGGQDVHDAIADYRGQCERVSDLMAQMPQGSVTTVRYEDLVEDVPGVLVGVCRFLGVKADESYLAACRAVVENVPRRDRDRIAWDPSSVAAVESVLEGYDFLRGYRFEGLR
ncbi:MAG TPA: sulfotransferase [Acidimicrobiia bacterium]|nr:sulfotransferase [Acidimicrobiia bacterium]